MSLNIRNLHREREHADDAPVAVHDMTVAYRRKSVLWDIDIDIPAGKLVGVVGPNGAGKSTFIKACLDLVPKTSGWVKIFGKKYAEQKHLVGYVPQRESVDWDFPISALDVVTMGTYGAVGLFRKVGRAQRKVALEALERVGLSGYESMQISELSGGQQQRVFLARALAQDASVYFMDETFAAVDAATERAIVALLRELKNRGKTCVVVHHDLSTIKEYFDWVVLLNMRLVAAGPTDEVFTVDNLQKTYGGRLTLLENISASLRVKPSGGGGDE